MPSVFFLFLVFQASLILSLRVDRDDDGDGDSSSSTSDKDLADERRVEVDLVLEGGHRREINAFDVDETARLLVAAGRDRRLTFWDAPSRRVGTGIGSGSGRMLCKVDEAHSRLITAVR